jgi:hypothetical protein
VGYALTETENWDLLVDCTSRDGRKMLDAGVHLSDKCTLHSSGRRQGKINLKAFLEIIESVVSSPFVKAEAHSVDYFVLCLKRSVRLHSQCALIR